MSGTLSGALSLALVALLAKNAPNLAFTPSIEYLNFFTDHFAHTSKWVASCRSAYDDKSPAVSSLRLIIESEVLVVLSQSCGDDAWGDALYMRALYLLKAKAHMQIRRCWNVLWHLFAFLTRFGGLDGTRRPSFDTVFPA